MRGSTTMLAPRRRAARRLCRAATIAIGLVALVAAPASAGGVVGDPQPELVPFHVAALSVGGSGAVLPNGDIVLAIPATSLKGTATTITTCVLVPGGRACTASATLHAYRDGSGQDFFGATEVLATGGPDVAVVALDCCNIGPNGAVVFLSTNGGRTFGPLTKAGDIASIGAATFADGSIVVGSFRQGALQVQAFSPSPSIPQASYATPIPGCLVAEPPPTCLDNDTALTTYRGGVLVASDDTTSTHVEFAPSGSGLNTSSSYEKVGTFPHELVVAASGNALLTEPNGSPLSVQSGEEGPMRLRFFNGTSFGPAYKVPGSKAGGDSYFAMQETGGTAVHVFFISSRTDYDVFEETTTNGVRWSPLVEYATAFHSGHLLVPVLEPTGVGLLLETESAPVLAQPVLGGPPYVHVAVATPTVRSGHPAVLTGNANPYHVGGLVTLEHLVAGQWYPVRTTRIDGGSFRFGVPGVTATYRAVTNLVPGRLEYGYSNAATLTAVR